MAGRQSSKLNGSVQRQRGVAAIEFAMVLTVLLLILLAIVGYGAIFWAQQQLSAAAGEGARAGLQARYAGQADIQAVACDAAVSVFGPGTKVECNRTGTLTPCTWTGADGAAVGCMDVVLRYDVAQWPLLQSFQNLLGWVSGAKGDRLVPSTLRSRATIQITQEPL
ncbi:TadE/TadG family type IV pilus assembly protein [Bordetella sp. BOR01]|uniref:TadE/TadG family type IV pilus assembly protein n=1 Tax=Bordetella sp. BOR01 TaxID=2854779 RepID=UPI001C4548DB|nr:TadE/TadG family type IV pilus assembly protein [Bordetella sp. BOR01]MBV7486652.1 pilus assembly protein [Bordetella sp. BOR01]